MKGIEVLKPVSDFARFLFAHFFEKIGELLHARGSIPANDLMKDTLSTLLSAGMMLIFNLTGLLVFLFLPQGRDVLLIVSEDITDGKIGSLLWLAFGTLVWSLFSEFGMRYAIYVTDNSGVSLSEARVNWRRKLQVVISDVFIILPFLIVILGMVFNRPISDVIANARNWYIGLWAPVVVLYLLMTAVAHIYFIRKKGPDAGAKPAKPDPTAVAAVLAGMVPGEDKSKAEKTAPKSWKLLEQFRDFIQLSKEELEWCGKLTGIYNPFIFLLPKPSNFTGVAKERYRDFDRLFSQLSPAERNRFPQNKAYLSDCSVVPASFSLIKYTEDYNYEDADAGGKQEWELPGEICNGRYRWVYFIPGSFYARLHRMLYLIVGLSLLFLVLMLIFPAAYYQNIGAPGLLTLAFACWTGIYVGVLYVDYAVFRRGKPLQPGMPEESDTGVKRYVEPVYGKGNWWRSLLSLRAILLVLILLSSAFNDDHPVRMNQQPGTDNRPEMIAHFREWFNHYQRTASLFRDQADTTRDSLFYPIVLVCAEGGALRTAAYTSMMLGTIQDSLLKENIDFKSAVYAYSGISGGSLGLAFFNTIAYMDGPHTSSYSYRKKGRDFFTADYLAAVIARMCYSEVVQLILPWHVEKFDRAIALESNWESSYDKIGKDNYFATDFLTLWHRVGRERGIGAYPALFVNTTEVETGLQCWLTNVKPDTTMFYAAERDLLRSKIKGGINYSTMINFSTRFPLLSPAGCLLQSPTHKLHYVDGGYVENTGSATMTEILRCIGPAIDTFAAHGVNIRPFVVTLRFGEDAANGGELDMGNELSEIIAGIYNVRGGRVMMAERELDALVQFRKGRVIPLRLARNVKDVPMNWVLSARSLNNLDTFVNETWKRRRNNCLSGMYCIGTKKYRRLSADTSRDTSSCD